MIERSACAVKGTLAISARPVILAGLSTAGHTTLPVDDEQVEVPWPRSRGAAIL